MLGRDLTPLLDHSNWFLVCFDFVRSAFLHDLFSVSITQVLSITGMNTVWLIIRKNHLRFSRSTQKRLGLWRRGWQIGRPRTRDRNKVIKRKFKIVVEIGRKVGFVCTWTPGHVDTVMLKYDLFYTHSALLRGRWWIISHRVESEALQLSVPFLSSLFLMNFRWFWACWMIGLVITSDLPANAEVLCFEIRVWGRCTVWVLIILWTIHHIIVTVE